MKTSFDLTLFDDWETERKLEFLNKLETLFDHTKNTLPSEYYH